MFPSTFTSARVQPQLDTFCSSSFASIWIHRDENYALHLSRIIFHAGKFDFCSSTGREKFTRVMPSKKPAWLHLSGSLTKRKRQSEGSFEWWKTKKLIKPSPPRLYVPLITVDGSEAPQDEELSALVLAEPIQFAHFGRPVIRLKFHQKETWELRLLPSSSLAAHKRRKKTMARLKSPRRGEERTGTGTGTETGRTFLPSALTSNFSIR